MPGRIAVLASGAGTTFANLLRTSGLHGGEVCLLATDRECGAAGLAGAAGVEHVRESDSARLFDLFRRRGVELACCAGWLRRLAIPADFENRVMNIHPSLLPAFGGRGMYGPHVHRAVHEAGCRVSGCTVHFCDDGYDHGPIIIQRAVPLPDDATPEAIGDAVKVAEDTAYPQAVRLFLAGVLLVAGRRVWRQP